MPRIYVSSPLLGLLGLAWAVSRRQIHPSHGCPLDFKLGGQSLSSVSSRCCICVICTVSGLPSPGQDASGSDGPWKCPCQRQFQVKVLLPSEASLSANRNANHTPAVDHSSVLEARAPGRRGGCHKHQLLRLQHPTASISTSSLPSPAGWRTWSAGCVSSPGTASVVDPRSTLASLVRRWPRLSPLVAVCRVSAVYHQ
ncbi:hypothetical protein G7046_g3472 [Stylonectria norvegica]|nr:hypothetical protein G7046_g3472 [Stylonectria norvegica]